MLLTNLQEFNDTINDLSIVKRNQKNSGCNYYFNPNVAFKIYDAPVLFVDKKYIVFRFDKVKYAGLLAFLRGINDIVIRRLKFLYSELHNKDIYGIIAEQDTTFTLRCYLPTIKTKYNVKSFDVANNEIIFNLPRNTCVYSSIKVEIRNLWNTGNTYGFNIELKEVHV